MSKIPSVRLPAPVRLYFCATLNGDTPAPVAGVLFKETPEALYLSEVVESAIPMTTEEMNIAESKGDGSDEFLIGRPNVRAYERHTVIYTEFLDEAIAPDVREGE